MEWFYSFLNAVRYAISQVLQLLGVLFGLIPKSGPVSPRVWWIVHYVFVVLFTLLLAWISPRLVPEASVPFTNWFVQRFYVAIQFVLLYLFIRLLIAGILLFLARDISEFEDIDRAWYAGLDALAREGFDVQWLPVFLVNGATPEQAQSLFQNPQLQWKVKSAGEDSRTSALSFYACDEALFICLNDVGAMSRQLKKTVEFKGGGSAAGAAHPAAQRTLRPDEIRAAVEQTHRPEELAAAVGRTMSPAAFAAATAPTGLPSGGARFGETMRPVEMAGGAAPVLQAAAQAAPLEKLGKEELRLNRRRLDHLCQRLVAERGSFCPLNGLLQVIPLRWTQSTAYEPLFAAAQQDLQTLHDSVHMQFPVVCLHAGLEEVNGLSEFIVRGKAIDSRFSDSRAGSRYPAGLAIDDKSAPWVIERSLQWFRDWVYAEFAKNLASAQNRRLYQFLCALMDRRDRLKRELQSLLGDLRLGSPVRLSGCYFAATGVDSSRQAFVHGVMQRLMSEQNDVTWAPEWQARDRRLRVLTIVVALIVLGMLAVDFYLIWRIWEHFSTNMAG